MIQGYVDELSTQHIKGWAWDTEDPSRRLPITVSPGGLSLVADQRSDILAILGIGDACHAFAARFQPPLTEPVRAGLTVFADGQALPFAPGLVTTPPTPRFQGYLDTLSIGHAAGWLRDLDEPSARFTVEAWLDGTCLARAIADEQTATLTALGVGAHGFTLVFPRRLMSDARDRVEIRIAGHAHRLERAPALSRDIALFCPLEIRLIDEHGAMPADILALAWSWLPYAAPGGAVLTGIPDLLACDTLPAVLASVPDLYRDRLSLRTSLAYRAPPIMFERIAKSMLVAVHVTAPAAPDKFYTEQRRALSAAIARIPAAMRTPALTDESAMNQQGPFTAIIAPNGRITINEPNKHLTLDEKLTEPETLLDRLAS